MAIQRWRKDHSDASMGTAIGGDLVKYEDHAAEVARLVGALRPCLNHACKNDLSNPEPCLDCPLVIARAILANYPESDEVTQPNQTLKRVRFATG